MHTYICVDYGLRATGYGQRRCMKLIKLLPGFVVSALLTSSSLAADRQSASQPQLDLAACTISGFAQPVRCGVLEVPEDPARPQGRRLPIHVAVVPATAGPAVADPIVVLSGGPGEEAIAAAPVFAELLTTLRRDRDLLLVDQRGTGKSAALSCKLYSADDPAVSLRDLFPPAAVERCQRELSTRADLTQYSYTRFA